SLAIQFELNCEDAAFRSRSSLSRTQLMCTSRVWKDAHVELNGLLSVVVEPQKRPDLRHRSPRACTYTTWSLAFANVVSFAARDQAIRRSLTLCSEKFGCGGAVMAKKSAR